MHRMEIEGDRITPPPNIRLLTSEDLGEALGLSTSAGWNQQLDDWRMLVRIAPNGSFAASIDGRIVGTAIGIDYGAFGWIAMMLVDPAYRRCGLGARLLEAAMHAVPAHLPIRLDATPLGRPLYQKYGFKDEALLSRLVSRPSSLGVGSSEPFDGSRDVRPLTPSDLELVIDRDREAFGGTRGVVLEWAFHSASQYAHVLRSGDGLTHYCLGRRGRLFDQIGPVVAAGDDIALAVVSAAIAAAGDRPVVIDAFDSRTTFTTGLRLRGFSVERPLYRMCRPVESEASAVGIPRRGSLAEFAILGPEFA
jgi:GNAT superfamily N-acetyltransferase